MLNVVDEEQGKPEGADFSVDVDGKTIWCKNATLAQFAMAKRMFEAEGYGADAVVAVFSIVDSQIIDEDDRKFLSRAVLAGRADEDDALKILRGGKDAPVQAADDEDQAADVKPVKTTASPRRVKR